VSEQTVRVEFTCEQCGHKFPHFWSKQTPASVWENGRKLIEEADRVDSEWPQYLSCPNCFGLYYDGLTEELVAEALYLTDLASGVDGGTAWQDALRRSHKDSYWMSVVGGYRRKARFVLRLMTIWDSLGASAKDTPDILQKVLRDLAKEQQ
jgi:hypothetical protein